MTITDKTMEWLSQNRMRSYPMARDAWRKTVSPKSGLDCVVLDALLVDPDADAGESLSINYIYVSSSGQGQGGEGGRTMIGLEYHGRILAVKLTGGGVSGPDSFETYHAIIQGAGRAPASLSMVFSSHRYILDSVGEGMFYVKCDMLPSRVIRISDGIGASGIKVNGSEGVEGHDMPAVASGDIVLEDGYRTSPIILNGAVMVRVGTRYGLDPCNFKTSESHGANCSRHLFYFCGQNAAENGNIVLSGGKGVHVSQGRDYKVRSGTCKGKTIPCIEVVAGRELLDMARGEGA